MFPSGLPRNDLVLYAKNETHARKIMAEHNCRNIEAAIRELRLAGVTKFRPYGQEFKEVVIRINH